MQNTEFDQNYTSRLAKVCESKNVTFCEDVLNTKGVLVAKKNTQMTQRNAEIIIRHKLIKPIEHCVSIEGSLFKNISLEFCIKHYDKINLAEIMKKSEFTKLVVSPFHYLSRYPLIEQKLTVMSITLPEVFEKTLLCSILCYELAREMAMNDEQIIQVFIASILSDVGLLHLPVELVEKKGDYSIQELKMMQSHVVIAKHVADFIPNIPKGVGRAILEHHERPDGFGYPRGKTEGALCMAGQILAMADTICALYFKHVVHGSKSWNAVAAIIQVPSASHTNQLRNTSLRLLKRMNIGLKNTYQAEQFGPLVESLKQKHKNLNEWFSFISALLDLHRKELTESDSFRPFALLGQLNQTIVSSGLLQGEVFDWLDSITMPLDDDERHDIEEYELKLGEIEYQCRFVMRRLEEEFEQWSTRFNSSELAEHYYSELMLVLAKNKD